MRDLHFDGRLGADARVLTTKDGRPYLKFSVANNIFKSGQEITEWFDVTCYNDYLVQKADILKKGSYVLVAGDVVSEVNVKDGKVYLNHYVKAYQINKPRLGKGPGENGSEQNYEPSVSTYTGGTPTFSQRVEAPRPAVQSAAPAPAPHPAEAPVYFAAAPDGDDLPF